MERQAAAEKIRQVIASASEGLVEREAFVELILLGAVAGEHLLAIGPPGTAKSEGVRRAARALGGQTFEYLLGRFTEPSEIFGPVDLRKLREGTVETETAGMLPEAELAFLDEVFLGSTAILNTLLGVLNERQFVRGHTRVKVPLRVCVGASNAIPDEPSLAAFADRFLLQVFLEPLPDLRLEELLERGWSVTGAPPPEGDGWGLAAVDTLREHLRDVDLRGARPTLAEAIRALRGAGVELTDRRAVKVQKLVAAAALLAGRSAATRADLWPLVYAVPGDAGQQLARDTLRELLEESRNEALAHAAEQASLGPRARAARLLSHGRALLEAGPVDEPASAWRRKLEGVAREIDAGFSAEQIDEELRGVREQIVAKLTEG